MKAKSLAAAICLILTAFPVAMASPTIPFATHEPANHAIAFRGLAISANRLNTRQSSSVILQDRQAVAAEPCGSMSAALERADAVSNPTGREESLGTLRSTASRGCARVLLSVLQGDWARDIQQAAIEVLVAVGDDSVVRGVEEILGQNPDPAVRSRLAVVLENISTPRAAYYLSQALSRNRDETLKISVPKALGRIGTPESVARLVDVSASMGEADRPYLLKGFALIRNTEALPTLLNLLESPIQDSIREGVVLALGNYDEPEILAVIESHLKMATSERVREALHVSRTRILQRATKPLKD